MTNNDRYDENLTSVMAHELRTPLSSVSSLIEMAMFAGDLNPRQTDMLEKAMLALERMNTLIDDVLEMSQADADTPLDLQPCDMRAIVNEAVALVDGVAERKSITVYADLPDDIPPIPAEANRIKHVPNNLISNAVKYNGEGGNVWVTLATTETDLILTVKDNGYGIPPEDLPHIFERFFRSRLGKDRRIHGSGVGLAIVKTIVERHNGTIAVQSELDKGTTFTVRLPRRQPSPTTE